MPAPPVPLSRIVKRQGIPEPFLRQIFHALRRAGLVEAVMGKNGGYRLGRDPSHVTAYEVARALGDDMVPVACVSRPEVCCRVRGCPTRALWSRVADMLRRALSSTTIDQLAGHYPPGGRRPKGRGTILGIGDRDCVP